MGGILSGKIRRRGGDKRNPQRFQEIVASELDGQVAREPVWALHDNAAHAIAGDPVEHRLKARAPGNRIGTADRRVVKLGDDDIGS